MLICPGQFDRVLHEQSVRRSGGGVHAARDPGAKHGAAAAPLLLVRPGRGRGRVRHPQDAGG